MIFRIITLISLLVSGAEASVIRMPVTTGPFGGSQIFTLTDNTGATIALNGRNVCTRDIPSSSCSTSIIVTGGAAVEFLLSDGGAVLSLSGGDVLSSQPETGSWGANILNRYEFLISRSSLRNGTFTPLNNEYIIGFRVSESDGNYRYGWLESNPHFSGLGAIFDTLVLSDGVTDSLVVTPIPEPTSSLLIAIGASTLAWRTRRRRLMHCPLRAEISMNNQPQILNSECALGSA